jgi:hypothetical protein
MKFLQSKPVEELEMRRIRIVDLEDTTLCCKTVYILIQGLFLKILFYFDAQIALSCTVIALNMFQEDMVRVNIENWGVAFIWLAIALLVAIPAYMLSHVPRLNLLLCIVFVPLLFFSQFRIFSLPAASESFVVHLISLQSF